MLLDLTDLACFVSQIERWQTLIGALVGGIMALVVAFVVANAQTRREQRASAYILLVDLLAVQAADQSLTQLAKGKAVSSDELPLWLSEKLSWRRPRLSALFQLQMVRVIDVSASLSAHLSIFHMQYEALHEHLDRLEEDQQLLRTKGANTAPRSPAASKADAVSVAQDFRSAADHAKCAAHYLDLLVLRSFPTFSRIRMRFFPMEVERLSKQLLSASTV